MTDAVCSWATQSMLERDYHDKEWGVPLHDDKKLFELLILEGMQAGLSWFLVLKKREAMRQAFDGFVPETIALYGEEKFRELLANPSIIRNRLKIAGVVHNAKAFLAIQEEYGSFDRFLWDYIGGKPIVNRFEKMKDIPAQTPLSERISTDLKKRGFRFVGPTIIYSYLQATGMVNDHLLTCPRHAACCAMQPAEPEEAVL